jgi:hypothetical protein
VLLWTGTGEPPIAPALVERLKAAFGQDVESVGFDCHVAATRREWIELLAYRYLFPLLRLLRFY